MGGILGLKRNRSVARLAANLLGANGAMTVDSNGDGIVNGFTAAQFNCTPVYTLDGGQKVTLAAVTNANAYLKLALTTKVAVSPNIAHTLSFDAALIQSGAEKIRAYIDWYTAADVLISQHAMPYTNPGTTYSRQSLTVTSPPTAAKAGIVFYLHAIAVGATGVAWFKDTLFQAA